MRFWIRYPEKQAERDCYQNVPVEWTGQYVAFTSFRNEERTELIPAQDRELFESALMRSKMAPKPRFGIDYPSTKVRLIKVAATTEAPYTG